VRQILHLGVVAVKLVPVVRLVLLLVVAVVARPEPKIRQPHAAVPRADELVARDARIAVGVEEVEDLPRDGAPLAVVDVRVGVVREAVQALDVRGRPGARRGEVVQGEERGGVEALDAVLLWILG
jgi:hypothetical protein